jgi:cathepsin L
MRHHYAKFESDYVDKTIDWVQRGAVTRVKDDGNCGACWAHSAIAAIEGANFIKSNELLELSTQQLIDCDPYDYGCDGGFMANAFEYAQTNPLMLDSDYPYVGISSGDCLYEHTEA